MVSVTDFCGGASHLDPVTSMPLITQEHVQCARRLIDNSIMIRDRGSLEQDTDLGADDSSDDGAQEEQPVARGCNTDYYAMPLATQPPDDSVVAAARASAEERSLLAPDLAGDEGTRREARPASQNQPLDDTTEDAIAEDAVDIAERTLGDKGPGSKWKH